MLNESSPQEPIKIFGMQVQLRTISFFVVIVFLASCYGAMVFLRNMGRRNLMKTNPKASENIMRLLPSINDKIVDVIWKKNGGIFTWYWSGIGADAFLVLEQVANAKSAEQLTTLLANVVKEQKEQERYEQEIALKRERIVQEERKIALKAEKLGKKKDTYSNGKNTK